MTRKPDDLAHREFRRRSAAGPVDCNPRVRYPLKESHQSSVMNILQSLGLKSKPSIPPVIVAPTPPDLAPPLVSEVPVTPVMGMGMAALPDMGSGIPIPRDLFDDAIYLARNPDVAAEVEAGLTTAFEHYLTRGHEDELAGRRQRSLPQRGFSIGMRQPAHDDVVERLIELEVANRALMEAFDRDLGKIQKITFDMVSETVDETVVPPLDRTDCDESILTDDQRFWRDNGYLIKPGFVPTDLIDRYVALRQRHPIVGGWRCPVPYMHIAELRDISLYPPLMTLMHSLIGEEMGLHLNLTGWVSTDRNWHQDDYLNPPYINSWYSAVWVALDDIHPDCGPFEFVPGSHKWPLMKGHKVRMYLTPEERADIGWPARAERFVNALADEEIDRRGGERKKFIAKKGDLLIWHGRLMHRGSYANQPGMERRTLISHYSGLSHRVDMKHVERVPEGGAYFVHNLPLDWDPYIQQAAE